jgi:hypothetical protein
LIRAADLRLDNICCSLAAHPLPTRGGARYVTLSAGLALYQAKDEGRNRVCSLA